MYCWVGWVCNASSVYDTAVLRTITVSVMVILEARHIQSHKLAPWGLVFIFVALVVFFDPVWQTNDDVAMSQIVHGYGISFKPMPHLVFSNILWGWLLYLMPTVGGLLPYSYMTLAIILFSALAILACLRKMGCPSLLAVLSLSIVLADAIAFPQFTKVSGLATVAGVFACYVYLIKKDGASLIIGWILLFLGNLIRSKELILVLAIAVPVFPWRSIIYDRRFIIAATLLVFAISSAKMFDDFSYSGDTWRDFKSFNPIRLKFTDYQLGGYFARYPDIAAAHGFSQNDLALISSWFFVDPKIADPARISALLETVDWKELWRMNLTTGVTSIYRIFDPSLLPLIVPALLICAISPARRRLVLAIAIFIAAAFLLGLQGRPGPSRVFYPIACLLFISPLLMGFNQNRAYCGKVLCFPNSDFGQRTRLLYFVLAMCAVWAIAYQGRKINSLHDQSLAAQAEISQLDSSHLYVFWGADFPRELAYPVIDLDEEKRRIRIFGLGVFSLAPFASGQWLNTPWSSFRHGLLEGDPIPVAASDAKLALLREHCRAHYDRAMRIVREEQKSILRVTYLTCSND